MGLPSWPGAVLQLLLEKVIRAELLNDVAVECGESSALSNGTSTAPPLRPLMDPGIVEEQPQRLELCMKDCRARSCELGLVGLERLALC